MVSTASRMRTVSRFAPLNCDDDAGYYAHAKQRERCPRCGLYHLRLGYCSALDTAERRYLGRNGLVNRAGEPIDDVPDNVPLSDNPVPVTSENVPLRTIVPLSRCETCGADFEAKRSTARFCSDACRKRSQRP